MAAPWKGGILIHIICVDDEQLALDNFRLTVENMHDVETLHLFNSAQEALKSKKQAEESRKQAEEAKKMIEQPKQEEIV